jgi:hypothetical protein
MKAQVMAVKDRDALFMSAAQFFACITDVLFMYVNMGVQLQRAGRNLQAAEAYVKSIEMKPFVEAWHNLAGVYVFARSVSNTF